MIFRHTTYGAITGRKYILEIYQAGETDIDSNYVELPFDACTVTKYSYGGYENITMGAPSMPKITVKWNLNAIQGDEYSELREAIFNPEVMQSPMGIEVTKFRAGTVYAYIPHVVNDTSGERYFFIQTDTIWEKFNSKEHSGEIEAVNVIFFMLSNYGLTDSGLESNFNQEMFELVFWDALTRYQSYGALEYYFQDRSHFLSHSVKNGYRYLFVRKYWVYETLKTIFGLRMQRLTRGRTFDINFPSVQNFKQTYGLNRDRGDLLVSRDDVVNSDELLLAWIMKDNPDIRNGGTMTGGFLFGGDNNSIVKRAANSSFWDVLKDWCESTLQRYYLTSNNFNIAPILCNSSDWVIVLEPRFLNWELGASKARIKKTTYNIASKLDEDIDKYETLDSSNRNASSFTIPEFLNNMPVSTRYERMAHNEGRREETANKVRTNNIYYRRSNDDTELMSNYIRVHEKCNQILGSWLSDDGVTKRVLTTDKFITTADTPNLDYSDTDKLETSIVNLQLKTCQPYILGEALKKLYNKPEILTLKISDMPISLINLGWRKNADGTCTDINPDEFQFTEIMSEYIFIIDLSTVTPERTGKYWRFLGDLDFNPEKETASFTLISLDVSVFDEIVAEAV